VSTTAQLQTASGPEPRCGGYAALGHQFFAGTVGPVIRTVENVEQRRNLAKHRALTATAHAFKLKNIHQLAFQPESLSFFLQFAKRLEIRARNFCRFRGLSR